MFSLIILAFVFVGALLTSRVPENLVGPVILASGACLASTIAIGSIGVLAAQRSDVAIEVAALAGDHQRHRLPGADHRDPDRHPAHLPGRAFAVAAVALDRGPRRGRDGHGGVHGVRRPGSAGRRRDRQPVLRAGAGTPRRGARSPGLVVLGHWLRRGAARGRHPFPPRRRGGAPPAQVADCRGARGGCRVPARVQPAERRRWQRRVRGRPAGHARVARGDRSRGPALPAVRDRSDHHSHDRLGDHQRPPGGRIRRPRRGPPGRSRPSSPRGRRLRSPPPRSSPRRSSSLCVARFSGPWTAVSTGTPTTLGAPPNSFAERLRDEVDLDALRAEVERTVAEAIRPTATTLWLSRRERT